MDATLFAFSYHAHSYVSRLVAEIFTMLAEIPKLINEV